MNTTDTRQITSLTEAEELAERLYGMRSVYRVDVKDDGSVQRVIVFRSVNQAQWYARTFDLARCGGAVVHEFSGIHVEHLAFRRCIPRDFGKQTKLPRTARTPVYSPRVWRTPRAA